jgi:hypothetical protein
MAGEWLEGGYANGAVRVGDTVRRSAGPWTPAVHALLAYLADQGFTGAPRPLGFDEQGREMLAFLEGETIGHRKPRPAWVHAEDTLVQVARWMRELTGFFDWDFAGPATPEWDLALTAFTWVPLHVRYVVAAEGFTGFAARPGRLDRFLGTYGWSGTTADFLDVVEARMTAHAAGIRDKAAAGDEPWGRLLRQGVPDAIDQALADLATFPR